MRITLLYVIVHFFSCYAFYQSSSLFQMAYFKKMLLLSSNIYDKECMSYRSHRSCYDSEYEVLYKQYFEDEIHSVTYHDVLNKEIIVVFRGTTTPYDWIQNFKIWQKKLDEFNSTSKVHYGAYEKLVRNNSLRHIQHTIRPYIDDEYSIFFTGHSAAGQMATICGFIFSKLYNNSFVTYSFGSPFVGNKHFVNEANDMKNFIHYRIFNKNDIVPRLRLPNYRHHGLPVYFNRFSQMIYDTRDNISHRYPIRLSPFFIRDHLINEYIRSVLEFIQMQK